MEKKQSRTKKNVVLSKWNANIAIFARNEKNNPISNLVTIGYESEWNGYQNVPIYLVSNKLKTKQTYKDKFCVNMK